MRGAWLVVVVGCSGSPSSQPDASPDAALTSCAQRIPVTFRVDELAVDGSTLVVASYGTLYRIPLDGGAPTTIATSPSQILVASHKGSAAYAIATTGGMVEVRQLDGTVLGTVGPIATLLSSRMTETELVILGASSTGELTMYRVLRQGGGAQPERAMPKGLSGWEVGTSVYAHHELSAAEVRSLATGELVDSFSTDSFHYGAMQMLIVGDNVVARTNGNAGTIVGSFYPSSSEFLKTDNSALVKIFADDRYVYVQQRRRQPSDTQVAEWMKAFDIETHEERTPCVDFTSDLRNTYDANNIYGFDQTTSELVIAPRLL